MREVSRWWAPNKPETPRQTDAAFARAGDSGSGGSAPRRRLRHVEDDDRQREREKVVVGKLPRD